MKNTPYRKVYENGVLTNPITKDNPYIVSGKQDKRKFRKSNNSKGVNLVVAKIGTLSFVKYLMVKQLGNNIGKRLIVHSVLQQS